MEATKPHSGEGDEVIFAQNQPQYRDLPALRNSIGMVTTEWEVGPDELMLLMDGGRVRIRVLTFNAPLQPIKVDVVPKEP